VTRPRLGFIGLGWIGRMRLAAVASSEGPAEAAALCDPSAASLQDAAKPFPGVPCFDDYEQMLDRAEDLGLDGVVIATPNALHAPQTLAALDRGLAVFCQKPLALSAAEAREMVEASRRADRLLGVDYSYRHTEGAQALRRLTGGSLDGGELGRVYSLETVFHNAYGPDKPWCFDRSLSGGGALMDLGVHLVDLAFWLLGDPEVRAIHGGATRGGAPLSEGDVDDFASARIDLEGGGVISLAVSWNAHAGRDCVIRAAALGTAGGAEFRNIDGSFYDFELARFTGRNTEVAVRESRDWLGKAILDWAYRLGESRSYDPEIERSIRVSEVIDAVYAGG
jgi:predicted dehydrogenase